MVNHVETNPSVLQRMYVKGNKVITETIFRDSRSLTYFERDLLEIEKRYGVKLKKGKKRTTKRKTAKRKTTRRK